jgi:hypothetical protein
MNAQRRLTGRLQRGSSVIEFALTLPVLLAIVLGTIDFGRAIQFNNVLVGMSREAANLAARTSDDPTYIITAVSEAATPLVMSTNGVVYLTTLVGKADGSGVVTGQSRSTTGKTSIGSSVYACPRWGADGACIVPTPGPVVRLSIALTSGEVVHVAEVAYDFDPITGFVMTSTKRLYSQAIL